jgi:hypothetical protein
MQTCYQNVCEYLTVPFIEIDTCNKMCVVIGVLNILLHFLIMN